MQQVLVVVFEFDPAAAIWNDLAEEIALGRDTLEKHARRAVQLTDDHALGAVDDERTVIRHQRDLAEEDFLFLDVPDALGARFGVFRVHGQANGHLERRRVSHAPLFALCLVVLSWRPTGSPHLLQNVTIFWLNVPQWWQRMSPGWNGSVLMAAPHCGIAASRTQVVKAFEVAALAFPVADRVIDEFQLADAAEIGDGKTEVNTVCRPTLVLFISI